MDSGNRANGDPDESPDPQHAAKPVDAAQRLLPGPDDEADGEDDTTGVVRGALGHLGEPPPREGEQQRRVRKLRDGETARPALLAAPPKLGGGHGGGGTRRAPPGLPPPPAGRRGRGGGGPPPARGPRPGAPSFSLHPPPSPFFQRPRAFS